MYALSRRRPAVVVSILATLTLVLATLTSLAVVGGPALARSGPESPRVKYYLVTEEHASRPDALVDIARRLLGGEDERRHWHTVCWRKRRDRGPGRTRY